MDNDTVKTENAERVTEAEQLDEARISFADIRESAELGALVASLCKAQLEYGKVAQMRTGQIGHRQFQYANLDDYIESTQEALAKNGLVVIQFPRCLADEFSTNVVTTRLAHTSGQFIEFSASHASHEAKMMLRAPSITMLRRHSYCAIIGVASEDPDETEPKKRERAARKKKSDPKNPPPPPATYGASFIAGQAEGASEEMEWKCPHGIPLKGATCAKCDESDKRDIERQERQS